MKLILASSRDPAAMNITSRLLEMYDFEKWKTFPNAYISQGVILTVLEEEATKVADLPVKAEEVIVASRHASEAEKPSLTVHVPGELERGELALASPPTIKTALRELAMARDELRLPNLVSLEATHHGPTKLPVPVTFVEIGSTLVEWQNEKAGEAAARAIMKAALSPTKCQNAVGLGGPHYAPRHTEVTLGTDVGVGHILPKYAKFDEGLIELAVTRTSGGARLLALDWKGLTSEQRTVCQNVADRLKIAVKRMRDITS